MVELVIRRREGVAPGSQPVEIVERKGLGHPDTICDGIAEHVCVHLCRAYLERFDVILHHNVDKVLLCGGAARPVFGGGEVLEPVEIFLAGRATADFKGARLPVHEIAVEACRDWLRTHLRDLDPQRDVRIVSKLRPGSVDLTQVFARGANRPLSNDTSCGAGFAPMTDLERVVLAAERALTGPEVRRVHPEIGEDVKVMGLRRGDRIELMIGCAFVSRFVSNLDDYISKKSVACDLAVKAAQEATRLGVEARMNTADELERGEVYLTVTGTSAEAGDDGEVGRGNRVNGLITPYRPMTLEAAAGKNPVSHVGKIYNLAAGRIAAALTERVRGVDDATCILLSQIGRPVDDPRIVDVEVGTASLDAAMKTAIAGVVAAQFETLADLRARLLSERLTVC